MASGTPIATLFASIGADLTPLKQGLEQVKPTLQGTATQMTGITKEVGKTNEALGMSRREWMRSGSESMFYARTAMGALGNVNAGLSQSIGLATQLGESFMFGGGIGVGLAAASIAIGAVVSAAFTATPQVQSLTQKLDSLGKQDDAVRGLQQLVGVTNDQANAMLRAAEIAPEFARRMKAAVEAAQPSAPQQFGNWLGGVIDQMKKNATWNLAPLQGGDIGGFIQRIFWGEKPPGESLKDLQSAAEAMNEQTRLTEFFKNAMHAAANEVRSYNSQMDSMAKAHDRTMASFDTAWLEAERKAGIDRVKIGQDTAKTILKLNEDLGKRIGDINESLGKRLKEMDYQRAEQLKQFAKDALGIEKDYTQGMRDAEKDKNKSIADLAKDTTKSLKALDKEKGKDLAETEKKRIKDLASLDLDHTKRMARAKSQVEREAEEQDYLDARAQIEQAAQERKTEIEEAAAEKRKQIEEAAAERRAEIEERFRERQAEIAAQRQERRDALAERKSDYDKQFEHEKSKAKEEADYTIAQAKRANGEQIKQTQDREREQLEAINTRLGEEQRAINTRRDEENAAYESNKQAAWAAHLARMKAITDERDEAHKLADDIELLGADGKWKPFLDRWGEVNVKAGASASFIKSQFSDDSFKTTGATMTAKIGQGIDLGKGGLLTSVTDAIKYAVDLGTSPWQNAIEMIKAAGGWTMDRIRDGIGAATGLGTSIATVLSDAATGITTTATTLLRDLGALGGRVMAWVASGLTNISSSIASSISGAANGIVDVISGLSALGERIMGWIGDGIKNATSIASMASSVLTAVQKTLIQLGTDMYNQLRYQSGLWWDVFLAFAQRGKDFVQWMASGITAGVDFIRDALIDLVEDALGLPNTRPGSGLMASASVAGVATAPAGGFTFIYAPQMSLGTREEAETIIAPLVVNAYLDARSRGLVT